MKLRVSHAGRPVVAFALAPASVRPVRSTTSLKSLPGAEWHGSMADARSHAGAARLAGLAPFKADVRSRRRCAPAGSHPRRIGRGREDRFGGSKLWRHDRPGKTGPVFARETTGADEQASGGNAPTLVGLAQSRPARVLR